MEKLPIRFTERQHRIIAWTITLMAGLVSVSAICFIVWLILRFIGHYSNVLLPPVVGIVFAMIFQPLYLKLLDFTKGSRAAAVSLMTVIVLIPLCLFLWFFGTLAVRQLLDFIQQLPVLYRQCHEYAAKHLPELQAFLEQHGMGTLLEDFSPDKWISAILSSASITAMQMGSWVVNSAGVVLGWLSLPIYTVLFLTTRAPGGSDVRKLMVFTSAKTAGTAEFLIDQFLGIVVSFFRGQVLVALVQGILFGIGFEIVGLNYGLVVGLALGLLNIVPYLGNFAGLSLTLPLALLGEGGGPLTLVLVLAVFTAVQTLDSFFITPRIMGNRTGLSPLVIIFSLFFWNAVIGGILGMILAIPLSAFIVVFWRLLKREYFPEIQATATNV